MIFLGGELGCTINDIFGLDKKLGIGNSDYVMLFSWHSQKIKRRSIFIFPGLKSIMNHFSFGFILSIGQSHVILKLAADKK